MNANASRRAQLLSGLILLGVFLAGAATGAGVLSWTLGPGPHHGPHGGPGHGPPYLRELQLTEAQRAKAQPLFEQHHQAIEAVMRERFPQIRALNEKLETELKTMLTAEQAKVLDEWKAREAQRAPPQGGSPFP